MPVPVLYVVPQESVCPILDRRMRDQTFREGYHGACSAASGRHHLAALHAAYSVLPDCHARSILPASFIQRGRKDSENSGQLRVSYRVGRPEHILRFMDSLLAS